MPRTKGFSLRTHPDWIDVLEPYYRDDRDPAGIPAGSHSYIRIACPECGKEREIPARLAIQGRLRCKPCAMREVVKTRPPKQSRGYLTDLPEWEERLSALYCDEKDPSTVRQASNHMIDVICPDCGQLKRVSVRNWTGGQLCCHMCAANTTCKLDETESWKENRQWYRDERDPHMIPQSNKTMRIKVECPECGEINEITPFAFSQKKLRHRDCKHNGRIPNHMLDEDPAWKNIQPFYADEADPHTLPAYGRKCVQVVCPICNQIHSVRINHLTAGGTMRCRECAQFHPRAGSCFLTESDEWPLIQDAYADKRDPSSFSQSSRQRILVECPICSKQRHISVQSFRRTGGYCWTCGRGEPYLERKVRHILEALATFDSSLHYESQWVYPFPTGAAPSTADFAVLDTSGRPLAVIECQGRQHYEPIEFFGGQEAFEKQQRRDSRKREWCEAEGVPMLEIPYTHVDDGYEADLLGFLGEHSLVSQSALRAYADAENLPASPSSPRRTPWESKRTMPRDAYMHDDAEDPDDDRDDRPE